MVFHIARALATCVESWNSGLRVDVEYNRAFDCGTKLLVTKRLSPADAKRLGTAEFGIVYPDIIIHDPKNNQRNILVVEAKVRPSSRQRNRDLRKLRAFRQGLSYDHAVYLELTELPQWQWVRDTDRAKPELQSIIW
jgi:hypothetical protein